VEVETSAVAAEVVAEVVEVAVVDQTATAIRSIAAVSVMIARVHAPVGATVNVRQMLQTRWISQVSIPPKPKGHVSTFTIAGGWRQYLS